MPADKLAEILKQAEEERKHGHRSISSIMKKNKKFQKEQLTAEGIYRICRIFNRM